MFRQKGLRGDNKPKSHHIEQNNKKDRETRGWGLHGNLCVAYVCGMVVAKNARKSTTGNEAWLWGKLQLR